jgi:hypothetical protein
MWPVTALSNRLTKCCRIEGAEAGTFDSNLGFCHRWFRTDRVAIVLRESSGCFFSGGTENNLYIRRRQDREVE